MKLRIYKTLYVVASIALVIGCLRLITPEPTPSPKTLPEIIALNMKEHTNDWTVTELNDTIGILAWMRSEHLLENKSICIKIKIKNYYGANSIVNILEPDTMLFPDSDAKIIAEAYSNTIVLNTLKRAREKADSINNIEGDKARNRENEILKKLCTKN